MTDTNELYKRIESRDFKFKVNSASGFNTYIRLLKNHNNYENLVRWINDGKDYDVAMQITSLLNMDINKNTNIHTIQQYQYTYVRY